MGAARLRASSRSLEAHRCRTSAFSRSTVLRERLEDRLWLRQAWDEAHREKEERHLQKEEEERCLRDLFQSWCGQLSKC